MSKSQKRKDRKNPGAAVGHTDRGTPPTLEELPRLALADDSETHITDEEQFSGVSGPSAPEPDRPRWPSLNVAVGALAEHFRTSHGLSIDKAAVDEFVAFYDTHNYPIG